MKAQKLLAIAFGLNLVIIGSVYVFFPEQALAMTGHFDIDAAAMVDVRATYGGIQFGFGLFILLEAHRPASLQPLLRMIAILFLSVGVVRTGSGLLSESALHVVIGVVEIALATIIHRLNTKALGAN